MSRSVVVVGVPRTNIATPPMTTKRTPCSWSTRSAAAGSYSGSCRIPFAVAAHPPAQVDHLPRRLDAQPEALLGRELEPGLDLGQVNTSVRRGRRGNRALSTGHEPIICSGGGRGAGEHPRSSADRGHLSPRRLLAVLAAAEPL